MFRQMEIVSIDIDKLAKPSLGDLFKCKDCGDTCSFMFDVNVTLGICISCAGKRNIAANQLPNDYFKR